MVNLRAGLLGCVPLALLLSVLAWALTPSLTGDFVADDYVFLATARMVDAPLTAFWHWHFYEPVYFRPVVLVVWWVTGRWFGLDYAWHAAFNAVLHMTNVALLWVLLGRFVPAFWPRVLGVAWFAFGPLSLGAVLWLSDRFDLLAVTFLLVALLAALWRNRVVGVAFVFLASLAACWSKEWALVACLVAALLMMVGARSRVLPARPMMAAGMLLAVALAGSVAAVLRSTSLDGGPASVVGGFIRGAKVADGLAAWFDGAWRIAVAQGLSLSVAVVLVGAAAIASLVCLRRFGAGAPGPRSALLLLGGSLLMLVAVVLPQLVTVGGYLGLIDSGAFGVATTARFYYGAMVAFAGVLAALLAMVNLRPVPMRAVAVCAMVCGAQYLVAGHRLATDVARWATGELAPIAVAATKVVDAVANDVGEPCVVVLLGTQVRHPYFRMFSDAIVKARTRSPVTAWRCHVMAETTPWVFVFPSLVVPVSLPLRAVPFIGESAKPDTVWNTARYRYRLPASDMAALPGARYFDWRDGAFVEVTDSVRGGGLRVGWADW